MINKSVIWFTEGGTGRPIGIVTAEDEVTGDVHAYIGTGNGVNEPMDIDRIIDWGAKLRPGDVKRLLQRLEE